MNFRWSIAPPQPLLVRNIADDLKVSSLLAQCLANRGLTDVRRATEFLEPRLRQLSAPFLLPNMEAAVARLFLARSRGEPLVIFGDYDVDGVSSTALLTEVLGALGWAVHHYLPHRLDEGYGLSREGVENCLAKFPTQLLLAVDCGSTAVASIEWLNCRGVDVIVLDHHQVSTPPPAATALVNPQLRRAAGIAPSGEAAQALAGAPQEAGSRFCELCSAGLAFKLAHAVVKRGRETGLAGAQEFDLRPLLDLVALGTIADLVPLTGENRILVTAGLQRLNTTGRLETATAALNLLLAHDLSASEPLARELDARNRERQQIERNIAEQVIGALRPRFDPERDLVIVEGQLLWHIGVVGIVASRVWREFHRPTIIIGGDGEEWRGSGRSIDGFDLAAALRECGDLLLRHGGHAMAAGLSIHPKNLDALRNRLNELARRTLSREQLQPLLLLDAEVSLPEMTLGQLEELRRLEPAGQGNPAVQLAVRNVCLKRPPQRLGRDQQHAKLWITDGRAV